MPWISQTAPSISRDQVERLLRLFVGHSFRFRLPFRLRQRTQIYYFQLLCLLHRYHLHRLSIDALKRGSQNLVAAHNLAQAALQRLQIQRPVEVMCIRNVIDRTIWFQLIQKP